MPICDPPRRLHAAMAGTGDPYAALTPLRLRLLRGLHDAVPVSTLASSTGLTFDRLLAELDPLRAASLVTDASGYPRPSFLVVTSGETARVDVHAAATGQQLAARIRAHWATIVDGYARLAVSATTALAGIAFLLVGDRVLDVGLLDGLAREHTLMPPAPARPSPGHPDARYYFWMIEGNHAQLGRYGQRVTPLADETWSLLTFGEYTRGDVPNDARDRLEGNVKAYLAADPARTPARLAGHLGLPLIDQEDARAWWGTVRACVDDLVGVYRGGGPALRRLYAGLSAGAYLHDGFGEFVCWYDHLAYAHAIDTLAEQGLLTIPPARFSAAIWQDPPESSRF